MRKRACLARSFRVVLCVGICGLLVAIVSRNSRTEPGENGLGESMKEHFRKTLAILDSYRYVESAEGSGLEEISMDTDMALIDHKDASGEWFERPMVLTQPELLSLVRRDVSRDKRRLTLISIDYKIGPIFTMKYQLQKYGVRIIEKSLSSFCHVVGTCSDLEIIERDIGLMISREEVRRFRRRYIDDPEFLSADGFICIYPVSICELFIPFNKTMILIVDGRFELGRTQKAQWLTWNYNLQKISQDSRHIIVTTNAYDMEYVKCFTGLTLPVVPYACDYVTKTYKPYKPAYLLMPVKKDGFERMILDGFRSTASFNNMHIDLQSVTEVIGTSYTLGDLRKYSGVVVVPHELSYLALTELLRHNIPMFMPSVELYARWHVATGVITERSLRSRTARSRWTHKHIEKGGLGGLPDPNDNDKSWAVGFWLTFAEFYSWPGVKFFDSVQDLAHKINATTGEDLFYASERMRVFNQHERDHINHFWETVIEKLIRYSNKRT